MQVKEHLPQDLRRFSRDRAQTPQGRRWLRVLEHPEHGFEMPQDPVHEIKGGSIGAQAPVAFRNRLQILQR